MQNNYITLEELDLIIRQLNDVKKLEAYGEEKNKKGEIKNRKVSIIKCFSNGFKGFKEGFRAFFVKASKRLFFATSMPFYWFIVFKHFVGWFDFGFFIFVVICSFALSLLGKNWGMINSAMN
ncbi:MAG: hypothetical protein N3D84_03435 [Candidatus Woesearchaeota archaeon]|nr:hypothetical protein [Candidatus Woesearchaeota archaeon]